MGTAQEREIISIPLKATIDLSTYQYRGLICSSADNYVGPPAAGGPITGVLQNKPAAAGRGADIAIFGVTPARAGGAITNGAEVAVAATGHFTVATSGQYICGQALTACASGMVFEMLISKAGYKG